MFYPFTNKQAHANLREILTEGSNLLTASAANTPLQQVTIIGTGRTAFMPENREQSTVEMVAEAVNAALLDADLDLDDMDATVTASVDLWDGRTASNVALTEVVGAVMGPETRIAADGLAAFSQAAMTVAAGAYETVLCVAHCKPSESDHLALTAWTLDPILLQPLGFDDAVAAGLQAELTRSEPQAWAEAVVRARAIAASDPLGPSLDVPEVDDVLNAPPLAGPLTLDMAAPLCDGAVAIVLGNSGNRDQGQQRTGIRVAGLGYATEAHYLGERDLVQASALRAAAHRAGVDTGDANIVELSAPYAHQEELFAEILGAGQGTLNPSGGMLGGAPPFAAGLARLVEVVKRLDKDELGIAHGTWGPAGQAQCVVALEA